MGGETATSVISSVSDWQRISRMVSSERRAKERNAKVTVSASQMSNQSPSAVPSAWLTAFAGWVNNASDAFVCVNTPPLTLNVLFFVSVLWNPCIQMDCERTDPFFLSLLVLPER